MSYESVTAVGGRHHYTWHATSFSSEMYERLRLTYEFQQLQVKLSVPEILWSTILKANRNTNVVVLRVKIEICDAKLETKRTPMSSYKIIRKIFRTKCVHWNISSWTQTVISHTQSPPRTISYLQPQDTKMTHCLLHNQPDSCSVFAEKDS